MPQVSQLASASIMETEKEGQATLNELPRSPQSAMSQARDNPHQPFLLPPPAILPTVSANRETFLSESTPSEPKSLSYVLSSFSDDEVEVVGESTVPFHSTKKHEPEKATTEGTPGTQSSFKVQILADIVHLNVVKHSKRNPSSLPPRVYFTPSEAWSCVRKILFPFFWFPNNT